MSQRARRAVFRARRAIHHAVRRAQSATHRDKDPKGVHDVHVHAKGHQYTVNAPKRW